MEQVDIKKMSVSELKELGFDTYNILAQTQANLQAINQELQSRVETPVTKKDAKAETS